MSNRTPVVGDRLFFLDEDGNEIETTVDEVVDSVTVVADGDEFSVEWDEKQDGWVEIANDDEDE